MQNFRKLTLSQEMLGDLTRKDQVEGEPTPIILTLPLTFCLCPPPPAGKI
jgi:hypothetical protein